MTNSPIITVSIATFNAQKFLAKAIDSILQQSFSDFELLIIDDGSEDGTEELIATYQDSRIVYIKHDQNQGLMKCRQEAIELARGKIIVWQDADDWSAPNRLERIFMAFEENPKLT
ncbi:MAG: glycosyltransferase family 2 protein, partial [Chitinophagaceae bacterium]|nr:glycosyltransferase family 2 protein [Chitinophagaceae bacterium]